MRKTGITKFLTYIQRRTKKKVLENTWSEKILTYYSSDKKRLKTQKGNGHANGKEERPCKI